jgi:hypothetical protein
VHALVGHLEVGHVIKVRDLELGEGVRAVPDAEDTVVTCMMPGKKAAEEAAVPAEPEIIGRKAGAEEGEEAGGE